MLAALLACALSSFAFEKDFINAQAAYDDGRFAEAATHYEKLLREGVSNPELHYNLANAYFKTGDLPGAVQYYRTAWYERPRDPDIRANLHFALNAAGAVDPAPSLTERLFFELSKDEWIAAGVAAYLLFALLLLLAQPCRTARRALLKASLLPGILALLAVGGWWQWQQLQTNPEWVVARTEATALFGPVEGGTAHYKLPMGALARQRSLDPKGWVEVEYDGRRGWLKSDYIVRISP
jgi:tetratricopeptide (TPR) repeat protein